MNVQEPNHIILSEVQRGGLNTSNLAKYSTVTQQKRIDKTSWSSENFVSIDNDENCKFFDYNSRYSGYTPTLDKAYFFDSGYTRKIGITASQSGSTPFAN